MIFREPRATLILISQPRERRERLSLLHAEVGIAWRDSASDVGNAVGSPSSGAAAAVSIFSSSQEIKRRRGKITPDVSSNC